MEFHYAIMANKNTRLAKYGWVWVIAALSLGAYLIAGAYGGGLSDSDSSSGANQQDRNAISNATHYDGLTDVGIPSSMPAQIKDYQGFRVSFNKSNHTPNWVAWELLATETQGAEPRSGKFWYDESIEGCADTKDYTRSGMDRGHMCPAADQKWSPEAMNDCFAMSNICPQDHSLNSGAWSTLEKRCRRWAERDSAIVIVCGPIYEESDIIRIGSNGVRVPGAFFKVIAAPYSDPPRGIAFVYPNMASPGNMQNYAMTIDEVEKLTGYNFFYNLPADIEEAVESVASFKLWDKLQ